MRRTVSLLLVSLFVPAIAGAQTDPTMPTAEATAAPAASADPLAPENWPLSGVDRPLGLSKGMLQLDVNGAMDLSKDVAGKTFGTPLVAYYGITNELQAAVLTTGLCLSDLEGVCTKKFDDLSLNILVSLFGRGSSLEVATFGQLNYSSFDVGTMDLQIGGAVNWVTGGGNVAIIALPNVGIGLAERAAGNEESIGIPVSAYFRAGEKVAPVLFTGLAQTQLDGFGDNYAIPVGVGVLVGLNSVFDVGARFDLPTLIAKDGNADARALSLWFSVRPL